MLKKTVIKRAYKTWPKTDRHNRLDEAIQYLNTEGGEGLDLTQRSSGGAPKDGALNHPRGLVALDPLHEDRIACPIERRSRHRKR